MFQSDKVKCNLQSENWPKTKRWFGYQRHQTTQMQPMWVYVFCIEVIWGNILNTHIGEKSCQCNQCNFMSSYLRSLRTHLKTHSGEKLNKCKLCNYASSQADSLRTHLKTHCWVNSALCSLREQLEFLEIYKNNGSILIKKIIIKILAGAEL